MKNAKLISLLVITSLVLSTGSVFAQTATPVAATNNTDRINTVKTKADEEIARRIYSLNELITKIQGLKRLADSDKSNLITIAQNEITALNSQKAKIDADTTIDSLRTDRQAITTEYRVYMLFMPQLRIYVAADRIDDTIDLMNQVLTKLQARATTDTQKASLTDAQTKLNDAKTQAANAITAIKNLSPDNGNNGIMSSNKQALLNAKQMLMTAMSDLQAARRDFATVRSSIKPATTSTP